MMIFLNVIPVFLSGLLTSRLDRGRLEMPVAGAPTVGWSVRVRSRKSHDFRDQKNQAGGGIYSQFGTVVGDRSMLWKGR